MQISRLSQLWFDALAGICAHVRHGGGGLTPSDIAPARLSQPQIDELQQQYRHRRRPAADPAAAGAALPRQHRAGQRRRRLRDAARHHRHRPARRRPAARCRARRGQPAPAPGGPVLRASSTNRCRSSPPTRWRPGATSTCTATTGISTSEIEQVCAAERAAVCDLADPPAFRVALIRTADDRHRFVLTNPPHRARRLVAADPAAGDLRRLLRAAAARAACRTAGSSPGWPIATSTPPARPGARCSPASTPPPWSARRPVGRWARAASNRSGCPSETTAGARRAGALAPHHRQHRAAGRLGAAADVADRPARRRLRHRGLRPADRCGRRGIDGGLLINTVPVRATHHPGHHRRRPARPAAALPQRHPRAPAPGAHRDPPHHRPRPTVRHPVRLRELPDRHRARCRVPTGWPSPTSPAASPTTTR